MGAPAANARPRRLSAAAVATSLLLLVGLLLPAWAGSSNATRIDVQLRGMDCAICFQGLEQKLRDLPGADKVVIDLERGRLSLQLRAGSSLTDDTLRQLLLDSGFVVEQIRRSRVSP